MRKMTLALGLLLIIFLVSGTLFFTHQATAKEDKMIRLGCFSQAVDYAPYFIARHKGWFDEMAAKYGSTVTYTTFQSLAPINESLATSKIDVVFEAEAPALIGRAAGIDLKIAAISARLPVEILVPVKSIIHTVAELKDKKIAVLAGTSSHYGLTHTLERAGLKKGEYSVVDMTPPDAKAAFEKELVDAWAIWSPFIEQAELAGTGRVLPQGDARIDSVMVLRGGFLKDNRSAATDIMDVIERSRKWIRDNPIEAQSIVASELKLPVEVVIKAWPRHDWDVKLSADAFMDYQAKADFLQANGMIRNHVEVAREMALP